MALLQYDNNVYKYLLLSGSQYKCMFVNYRKECELSDYHGGINSRSPGMWLLAFWWTDINSLKEGTAPSSESELSRLLSIHGSVHRESNLITVHQDATFSVYYIYVGSSTYLGC